MTEEIAKNHQPEQNEKNQFTDAKESASKFLEEIHTSTSPANSPKDSSASNSPKNDANYPKLIITDGTSHRPSDVPPNLPSDQHKHNAEQNSISSMIRMMPREREIAGGLPIGIEGKFTTSTGDQISIKDGKQVLTTAGGKTLEVDKDGNISGDGVTSIKASKDGKERTVTLEDGSSVILDQRGIARVEHPMPADKPGTYKLSTGDSIENSGDKQTLTTPAGTKLTVNKDGSYEVDGKVVSASADGKTIKLGDGSVVHLEDGKIAGVERNGANARLCGTIPPEQWDPRVSTRTDHHTSNIPPVGRPPSQPPVGDPAPNHKPYPSPIPPIIID